MVKVKSFYSRKYAGRAITPTLARKLRKGTKIRPKKITTGSRQTFVFIQTLDEGNRVRVLTNGQLINFYTIDTGWFRVSTPKMEFKCMLMNI